MYVQEPLTAPDLFALHSPGFRVYSSDDVVGQVTGA